MGATLRKSEPETMHTREVMLENEHVTLWYYSELKIVHHQMLGIPTSEQFRELLDKGAGLLERHRAIKWLSDDRANTMLKPHDEEWADAEWLPRVLRAGFKFWAIVLPIGAIGKLNMQRLSSKHVHRGVVSRIETTPQAAFEWLKAQ